MVISNMDQECPLCHSKELIAVSIRYKDRLGWAVCAMCDEIVHPETNDVLQVKTACCW
jgi:transcription elongation factor Elf1